MKRFHTFLKRNTARNTISYNLHHYGYSAVSTTSTIRSKLRSYQKYMAGYLKQHSMDQIQQQLNYSGNQSMKLAINNGRNDYSRGKSVIVYKPAVNETMGSNDESNVVSNTKEIYNILNDIVLDVYGDLCLNQQHLNTFIPPKNMCTHQCVQDESTFFANNQANSLTIYNYMSFDQCCKEVVNTKSCTSHFDSDLLTMIVLGEDIDGLEIATSINQNDEIVWESIKYNNFSNADLIIFGGALLQTISQQKYSAVIHRVQRKIQSRMSIVFKLKANHDLIICNPTDNIPTPTQIPSPQITVMDGISVGEFMEYIGSWNSIQRQQIMGQYVDCDELW
eukprot:14331_1